MTEAVTPPNPANPGGSGIGVTHTEQSSKPDPTLLTIDALRREVAMLENLFDTRIKAIDAKMSFAEEMRKEQKEDVKSAVNAALDSQKEAAQKMETAVSSQIASLRGNFETAIKGIESNLSDLKDRLTILESMKRGQNEFKSETRQVSASVVAFVGLGVAFVVGVVALLTFVVG